MKVIITVTFCCDNLSKINFMALEKPGKLSEFFLLLCRHPARELMNRVNCRSSYDDSTINIIVVVIIIIIIITTTLPTSFLLGTGLTGRNKLGVALKKWTG